MHVDAKEPRNTLCRHLGIGGADEKRERGAFDRLGLRKHMGADHGAENDERLAFDQRVEGVSASVLEAPVSSTVSLTPCPAMPPFRLTSSMANSTPLRA